VIQFLSLLFNGISLGALYALIALGFVIIFKASEVVSFTHGSLLLLGAYSIARLSEPIGFLPAVLVGILMTAAAAFVIERLVINRLRGAPVISLAIVTIGIDIIILTELVRRLGSDILNVPHPWGGESFRIRRRRHRAEPPHRHDRRGHPHSCCSSSRSSTQLGASSMRAAGGGRRDPRR
jgi:branched-chain amino acid transport system permease protein